MTGNENWHAVFDVPLEDGGVLPIEGEDTDDDDADDEDGSGFDVEVRQATPAETTDLRLKLASDDADDDDKLLYAPEWTPEVRDHVQRAVVRGDESVHCAIGIAEPAPVDDADDDDVEPAPRPKFVVVGVTRKAVDRIARDLRAIPIDGVGTILIHGDRGRVVAEIKVE
jgi:hypothetical protein